MNLELDRQIAAICGLEIKGVTLQEFLMIDEPGTDKGDNKNVLFSPSRMTDSALFAIRGFCYPRKMEWVLYEKPGTEVYLCEIAKLSKTRDRKAQGLNKDVAMAICQAILAAAEKENNHAIKNI